jgi:CRP-like cAMP-binding protein
MQNDLIRSLSKYTPITEELEKALIESAFIRSFNKGTVLLKEGDISNECYFILKGCIRSYYIIDGEERTTEFYTEEQVVSPSSYGKNIPSEYYLECIEETYASVGSPELETEMYEKYPILESLGRVISDAILTKKQDVFTEFKLASPEERYLNLLKNRPDLLQRAPQRQIANYLGMKPESLSRIRRRLTQYKKNSN